VINSLGIHGRFYQACSSWTSFVEGPPRSDVTWHDTRSWIVYWIFIVLNFICCIGVHWLELIICKLITVVSMSRLFFLFVIQLCINLNSLQFSFFFSFFLSLFFWEKIKVYTLFCASVHFNQISCPKFAQPAFAVIIVNV
jgi:hypothetical protein